MMNDDRSVLHHSLFIIHHSHELTQPIFLMFLLIGDHAPFLRGICVRDAW